MIRVLELFILKQRHSPVPNCRWASTGKGGFYLNLSKFRKGMGWVFFRSNSYESGT